VGENAQMVYVSGVRDYRQYPVLKNSIVHAVHLFLWAECNAPDNFNVMRTHKPYKMHLMLVHCLF